MSRVNENGMRPKQKMADREIRAKRFFPFSVDLRPLGKCILRCPFCFGPHHNLEPMRTADLLRIGDRLWNNGVRAIVLSGGEPTLLPNLEAVLRHMKQLGFTVVLSTNGVLLGDQLPAIASYLDWLSLPLDAITQDGCRQLRTGCPDHASIIRDLIPVIRREHPRIRIKLGTVVCKANAETVAEVLEFLGPGALPDKWKLYEVSYSNYAILNRDLIDLSTESFDLVCTRAAEAAAHYGVILAIHRDSERNGKYLFVDPNGDLICIAGGHEVKVGNILSQCSDDELQTMLCGVNYRSNLDNFLTTFGIAHSGE